MIPKIVKINWENGDVQTASPIDEKDDIWIFDVKIDNCYWAPKEMCEIIEL
jgi:hypothetical protein